MPLTDAGIRKTPVTDRAQKLYDGGDLYLLIKPSGSHWWRLKFRVAGKEQLLSLGVYPEVTLKPDQARCAMGVTNHSITFDPSNPEDLGRALTLLHDRLCKVEEVLVATQARSEATRCVLIGLVMSLGASRRQPFVAHSEIECALLSMRQVCGNSPEHASTLELATQLLDLYHGKLPPEDSPERPLLRLVQNAAPEGPAS